MRRTPVPSTHLKSIGYDTSSRTLEVEFQNGDIHQYIGVPNEQHAALVSSPSVGQYFNSRIKNGYASKKVGP